MNTSENTKPCGDWKSWLASNPPPDLQELVAHWGGYDKIPESAWDQFQSAKDAWEDRRMTRLLGPRWEIKDRQRKAPPSLQGRRPMR